MKITTTFFDRHVHLRRGPMLRLVTPLSKRGGAWGILAMPNTSPHLLTLGDAREYRKIAERFSNGMKVYPTFYLTENTPLDDIRVGFEEKSIIGVKWYPAMGTTNANEGVKKPEDVFKQLEYMEHHGVPLLMHGEIPSDKKDPLDFERNFLDEILVKEILSRFPGLKIVLEHITTKEATGLVASEVYPNLYATVAPQYLLFSHQHLFQRGSVADGTFVRGLRPDFWCMPILKREEHRKVLLRYVFSSNRFGAGTDSAPHEPGKKYCDCGCGGCFTAPFAAQMYAMVAEEAGKLDTLPAFLGTNLLREVYGIETPNDAPTITLVNKPSVREPRYCGSFLTTGGKEYGEGHVSVNTLPVDLTWSIE